MPDSSSITMILILVVLVILSAYFSATETAFTSLNRIRLKSKADSGNRRAALALRLVDQYDNLLSTILVGNNIVNLSASSLATVFFTEGLRLQNGAVISTAVITIVVLVFGEVSPKSLAKEYPESFAMFSAPMMRVLMVILTPVNFLFSLLKKLLSKVVHKADDSGITEEELVTMVDQAESEGGLDQHESKLIRSAIEFNDMEVDEILTPRVDIVAVEDTDSMEDIAQAFAESGYSRLPVYHEDIDDIVGVIHEKDFHAARYRGMDDIKSIMGPMLYTTGNTKISELLRILQREKAHMVVVVDEYGGTEGLVTLEDIVEELVGEIWDEHDEVIEEFKKQEDGSYLISCSADLTDLFDLFSIKGECDANTISGWVMEQIGRIPEEGDHFTSDGLDVTVTKVDHRRVLEIRVVVLPQEEETGKEKEKDKEKDKDKGKEG
ncbi:HlyC/CorC family transporter [Intestinimonas massiliensis (ex Afouda et al. 2020)]|uniref:HlyC/CorC family transporter n=1 Tax=Intestinimonas massiliensis (ex Afouda et al. 2020) TaxID=1673721 RepID=UPI001031DFB2|nr:hemolysin family protein [Intestinimonas massiliensis (ex Afouda et al. 2020)]